MRRACRSRPSGATTRRGASRSWARRTPGPARAIRASPKGGRCGARAGARATPPGRGSGAGGGVAIACAGGVRAGRGAPQELPARELTSGARVLVGAGDPAPRLERLAALLRAGLPEVAAAREIDLRFGDRMVLRGGLPGSAPAGERGGGGGPAP